MTDFITKFLPSSLCNEINYLQKGKLALNAETPKNLANNKDFITYVIDSNLPCDMNFAGPDIISDANLLLKYALRPAIKQDVSTDKVVPSKNERMLKARTAIATYDWSKAISLKNANNVICNIYNIVLLSVCADVENFQYASKELRDNYNIALAALKDGTPILQYVSERLCDDRDFASKAFFVYPSDFLKISIRLQSDKKFILDLLKGISTHDYTRSVCQSQYFYMLKAFINSPIESEGLYEALNIVEMLLVDDATMSMSLLFSKILRFHYKALGMDNALDICKKYNIILIQTNRCCVDSYLFRDEYDLKQYFGPVFAEKYMALGIKPLK